MAIRNNFRIFAAVLWLTSAVAFCATAEAATTTAWQGEKKFSTWSDVLNISGSKFGQAKPDDVLRLSLTATSGAQLQLSWGQGWTCFDGLEAMPLAGDFEMLLTAQDIGRLRQGLHVKGVNFTLTAVDVVSNDSQYTTEDARLFGWDRLLTSGATRGQNCTVAVEAYGGAGWYWSETADLSAYGSIVVALQQPAKEDMTVQLLYGETGVKSQTIAKGATQCRLPLSTAHRLAYSLNIISEKPQTVALASVNLTDRKGNIVTTAVTEMAAGETATTEYYDLAGRRLARPARGLTVMKVRLKGGKSLTRKLIIND